MPDTRRREPDRLAAPQLDDLVEQLCAHPLHGALKDEHDLRLFLGTHVFCVWDFMSLLKRLQRELTGLDLPWRPVGDPETRRLINALVLDEESDLLPDGETLSHYELYRAAMSAAQAETAPVDRLLAALADGASVPEALAAAQPPPGAAAFVATTLDLALHAPLHEVAAAFAWGREEIIPGMFRQLVETLERSQPGRWSRLLLYLQRHIQKDGEEHGPAAQRLVARLVGADAQRASEAQAAARRALTARLLLWDALHAAIVAARAERVARTATTPPPGRHAAATGGAAPDA